MKVIIQQSWHPRRWQIKLEQGTQSFYLNYEGSYDEVERYAAWFEIALANHDTEQRRLHVRNDRVGKKSRSAR